MSLSFLFPASPSWLPAGLWGGIQKPLSCRMNSLRMPHSQNRTEEKLEGYPKVEEESEQEVVIDFIPAETKDETPPPPPEDKTVTAEPDRETSTNPAPEVSPSSRDTGKDETPAAGSTNENGAVYDPVFGWVVPGQVNQTTVDSGGDPGKMVGNMGN